MVSKQDWKLFQEKVPQWQERYMDELVKDYIALLQSNQCSSKKMYVLEKRMKEDKQSSGVVLSYRKADVEIDLLRMLREKVITLDDLHDFSKELQDEIKEVVHGLCKNRGCK